MRKKILIAGLAVLSTMATLGWSQQEGYSDCGNGTEGVRTVQYRQDADPYYRGGYDRSYDRGYSNNYNQGYRYRQSYTNQSNNYYYGNDGRYYSDYGRRSKGKSAAIIGGSAAAGAVIGALAGRGKGAAIGALIGGVGGLIYDRSTYKTSGGW